MKTIFNIKQPKIVYKVERDENGNRVKIPLEKMMARSPEFVKPGTRFGYYLIDSFFALIFTVLVSLGILFAFPKLFVFFENSTVSDVLTRWIIYASYYFLTEYFLGGSLGKLIFGYVIIDEFAGKPTAKQIFIRSISRVVPFEAFSAFGETAWHDNWSKTYSVKKAERDFLLSELNGSISSRADVLD